jgi:PAN domain
VDFAALPDCRYHPRQDNSVISMDELQFAASQGECEALCDQARGFTCRAFTYAADEKRCYLSGDDSISLNNAPLMMKRGALYAEKQCSISKSGFSLFVFVSICRIIYFSLVESTHIETHQQMVFTRRL